MSSRFQKLTRPAVRALAVGQTITEHGIAAKRVGPGQVRYSINVMVDGERIHRVIGYSSDGVTREQAERAIETLRTRAREDRLALPTARKLALRFDEAARTYIERLEKSGGKTIARKKRVFALHLTPAFGAMPLSKLNASSIAAYAASRVGAGAKGGTVNRELAVLSHLLSNAVEWGWLRLKPKIERLKEGDGRIAYLTSDECARLIEASQHDASEHIHAFIVIALSSAMRMSEILSIAVANVDLHRRRIYLPKAKAGAREQPITTELASFLKSRIEALPEGEKWLFPSAGAKQGHLATIRKAHRRVVKAAGLDPDKVVRHTLRHTAITHLVQAGVDLPTVQKISGHKTLSMVARYAHANGAHIDEAMCKLGNRIPVSPSTPSIVAA